MEPNIKKYLIPCKDIESYNLVKRALENTNYNKVEMNNFNGTYDYIIECADEYANHLRNLGIKVIHDRPLYQCSTMTQFSYALTPTFYEPSGTINMSVYTPPYRNMSVYTPPYRKKTPAELNAELNDDINEPWSGVDINTFF